MSRTNSDPNSIIARDQPGKGQGISTQEDHSKVDDLMRSVQERTPEWRTRIATLRATLGRRLPEGAQAAEIFAECFRARAEIQRLRDAFALEAKSRLTESRMVDAINGLVSTAAEFGVIQQQLS